MFSCDVVILGAGPYGLAAAAHLGAIKGLESRVFGEPMDFDHICARYVSAVALGR